LLGVDIVISADTGEADDLLDGLLDRYQAPTWSMALGATMHYAKYVEWGTRKMRPRPFLTPAIMAVKGQIVEALIDGVTSGDMLTKLGDCADTAYDVARAICHVRTGHLRASIYVRTD
jgi:hypothetical protein